MHQGNRLQLSERSSESWRVNEWIRRVPDDTSRPGHIFAVLRSLCLVAPRGPCSYLWPARLQPTLICNFRAMPSLSRPVPSKTWYPGLGNTLLLSFAVLCSTLLVVPRAPVFSLVVRAAAANVNPRTRLSHMTPFIVCDWCTRERCRLMMQKSLNFPEIPKIIPRILRRARKFPRIFRQSQTGPRA